MKAFIAGPSVGLWVVEGFTRTYRRVCVEVLASIQ